MGIWKSVFVREELDAFVCHFICLNLMLEKYIDVTRVPCGSSHTNTSASQLKPSAPLLLHHCHSQYRVDYFPWKSAKQLWNISWRSFMKFFSIIFFYANIKVLCNTWFFFLIVHKSGFDLNKRMGYKFLLVISFSVWLCPQVQVKIYGPYNRTVYGNEVLITIVDPFSKWIMAHPSPEAGVEVQCANFIYDAFCQFGFAQCHVSLLWCRTWITSS